MRLSSINPCSSLRDGAGFPLLGITERLIPAHLTMLDEKECYSSYLNSGWHHTLQCGLLLEIEDEPEPGLPRPHQLNQQPPHREPAQQASKEQERAHQEKLRKSAAVSKAAKAPDFPGPGMTLGSKPPTTSTVNYPPPTALPIQQLPKSFHH